jgi:undecaprenyl diphosphate synthase
MLLVDARNLPKHIGIVMDGNGRWAELRGKPRTVGHKAGSHAVRRIVKAARRLGIEHLTLYAFSEQNWGRPNDEVDALMALLQDFLVTERDEILSNNIHLRAVGNVQKLPEHVREALNDLSARSSGNHKMVLTLCLSYGGREEITEAVRSLALQVRDKTLNPEDITEAMLSAHVPSVFYGDPDLMIRTGGEYRMSNFLLWGSAYAEFFFTRCLWPDFTAEHLHESIVSYQSRQRRFGMVQPVTRANLHAT